MQERPRSRFSRDEVGIGQCKQCGGPVTDMDQVVGETGIFCSDKCRDQYEEFAKRAVEMEDAHKKPRRRTRFLLTLLYRRLVPILLVVIVLGAVAYFLDLPFLGPLVGDLLGRIGL